ncbi:MAG: hypothetical protein U0414_38775 [Polyangiaceae bacterium]
MRLSMKPFATLSLLAITAASAAACDDTSGSASTATGGSGSTSSANASSTVTGSGSTSTGMEMTCEAPTGTPSAPKKLGVMSASGTIRDDKDMPVPNLFLQLCGTNICLSGQTGANGAYSIANGQGDLNRPFLKAGDGSAFAKIGYEVSVPTAMIDGVTAALTDSKTELKAGTKATAASITVDLDPMAILSFDITVEETPEAHSFRAAVIDVAKNDVVAPGQAFDEIVALGPEETLVCPNAKLSVPNVSGLAAGTAVDFYFQEVSIEESFGTYGDWAPIASGAVSADGMTIATDTKGIPVLGVYGIKAK